MNRFFLASLVLLGVGYLAYKTLNAETGGEADDDKDNNKSNRESLNDLAKGSLPFFEHKLKECVAEERYEDAAKYRDLIREIKKRIEENKVPITE